MNINQCVQVLEFLNFDTSNDIKFVNGQNLKNRYCLLHTPDQFALYYINKEAEVATKLPKLIKDIYGDNYQLVSIDIISNGEFQKKTFSTEFYPTGDFSDYLFFRPQIGKASLIQFIELVAHLRAPNGCPWDRKQTLRTLRTNLLEETHEVLEAIDHDDMLGLCEELGDLLLQIILQAQITSETNHFNIFDVINGILSKLIFRHPHVFSSLEVENEEAVLQNWEKWKAKERQNKNNPNKASILSSIPVTLPALSVAQKYQERAARVGFDWPEIGPVFDKVQEEIAEIKEAEDKTVQEMELGDLLFAVVNLIRWYGFDSESILRQMNRKFLRRFNFIEREVEKRGLRMTDTSLEELDAIWEMAKLSESTKAQNAL